MTPAFVVWACVLSFNIGVALGAWWATLPRTPDTTTEKRARRPPC